MSIGPLETLYIYMYKRCSAPPSTLVADGHNLVGESVAKFIKLSPHVTALANYSGRAAQ